MELLKELALEILKSNPGVINLLISGLLLPILVLALNNRQSRKIKELESQIKVNELNASKEAEKRNELEEKERAHEGVVLSSLYKILFDVQRLHIELSGNCVDYQCIDRAVARFQSSFEKYHCIISDNQIFLSSKVTGHLYDFYQSLAKLLIQLQDLKAANRPELALVSVFEHSQLLSEQVILIQEIFVHARKSEATVFKKEDLKPVSWCCGRPPRVEDKEALRKAVEELFQKKSANEKPAAPVPST